MRKLPWISALAFAAFVVVACGSASRSGFDDGAPSSGAPAGGSMGGDAAGDDAHADACQKMDIVFVVDDSKSMEEEQSNLAANFPKFASVLDTFKTKSGARLDYRVAVTTSGRDVKYTIEAFGQSIPQSEKGDNGAFRNTAACGSPKRWVDRGDADANTRFACLAKVGVSGPSVEMPLYALELALGDRVADGTNAGFRRDDALLAFVILTDEDDCSRTDNDFVYEGDGHCDTMKNAKPLGDFVTMLDVAAKGPGRWAAAVIAGDKSCTSSFGDAMEARRLQSFVSLAGKNGSFSSICAGDLTTGLEAALGTFDAACKTFPPVR